MSGLSDSNTTLLAIILFASLAVLVGVMIIVRQVIKPGKGAPDATLVCRTCGYDLAGLRLPRCPECGSVIGFSKTFDELGIDETEVIRHVEGRGGADGDQP